MRLAGWRGFGRRRGTGQHFGWQLRLWAAAATTVVLLTGCDPFSEGKLYREGIGTELGRTGLADATRAQDDYIGFLCQQAGLEVSRSGDRMRCLADGIGSRSWELIVQAGLNDIDVRCDAYLAWLDDKRRSQAPLLSQVGALRTATESIMIATGSVTGTTPIAVVGEAFGLATATFTNLHSRLLLTVEQSTVQSVVLTRRGEFRRSLKNQHVRIDNRPAGIHVLRSYLGICMPFNIEAAINTTVTTYELGGVPALERQGPLISPDTVQSARAIEPRDPIGPPKNRTVAPPAHPEYAEVFEDYNAAAHTPQELRRVQRLLCVPEQQTGAPGATTTALIRIFEDRFYARSADKTGANGRLDGREVASLREQTGACSESFPSNYFERREFTSIAPAADAVRRLVPSLPPSATAEQVRAAVRTLRGDPRFVGKVRVLPAALSGHISYDFWQILTTTP
jgi:hypothetical protein